jgi:hypothetical protein
MQIKLQALGIARADWYLETSLGIDLAQALERQADRLTGGDSALARLRVQADRLQAARAVQGVTPSARLRLEILEAHVLERIAIIESRALRTQPTASSEARASV